MRTYSKPIVEIENFRLDAQFASGGCAGVTVDSSVLATLEEGIDTYFLTNGEVNLGYTGAFIEFTGLTQIQYEANKEDCLKDLYLFECSQKDTDNPTSGPCYFTYSNASGKSFS